MKIVFEFSYHPDLDMICDLPFEPQVGDTIDVTVPGEPTWKVLGRVLGREWIDFPNQVSGAQFALKLDMARL